MSARYGLLAGIAVLLAIGGMDVRPTSAQDTLARGPISRTAQSRRTTTRRPAQDTLARGPVPRTASGRPIATAPARRPAAARPAQQRPAPKPAAARPAPPPPPAKPDSIRVESGVVPDTVTVGQPYRAVARITVPPGSRVEVTLEPADSESVEASGPVAMDTTAAAQGRFGAQAAFVAWRTGAGKRADALLRVTSPRGDVREVAFPFAAPFVRSVLPKDTAGIKPKGPKDVMDAGLRGERTTQLVGLGAFFFLLLLGLAYLLVRLFRRRSRASVVDPRERAIAELDALAASGAAERGDWRALYIGISDAVRDLAADLSPGWGRDLTTGELSRQMMVDEVPRGDVDGATTVLEHADLVKFARYQPSPETAAADLAAARGWVARIQPPARVEAEDSGDVDASEEDVAVTAGAGSAGGGR